MLNCSETRIIDWFCVRFWRFILCHGELYGVEAVSARNGNKCWNLFFYMVIDTHALYKALEIQVENCTNNYKRRE